MTPSHERMWFPRHDKIIPPTRVGSMMAPVQALKTAAGIDDYDTLIRGLVTA